MPIVRWISAVLLAAGLLIVFWDGYQIYNASGGRLSTSVRDVWVGARMPVPLLLHDDSRAPWVLNSWQNIADAFFAAPAVVVIALAGAPLWIMSRRRHRRPQENFDEKLHKADMDRPSQSHSETGGELRGALWSCRTAFLSTAAFSLIINVLMLTGAIFMLEVYDRVLPSRSVATLIGLCVIAGILFAALGLLDLVRNRLLVRAGGAIQEALAARAFDVVVRLPVRAGKRSGGLQPLRDLDAIRAFLSGPGPTALFDLPWLPLYLAIVYAFHPLLGLTALAGAVLLILLTLLTEILARKPMRDSTSHSNHRNELAEACLRNAEVLAGMGFASRLGNVWRRSHNQAQASQQRASDIVGGLGSIARVLRMVLQSAVLAIGAYLVILQQASAGIMIAGSILAARALAPVDIAIANWRGFIAARQSWQHLSLLLSRLPREVKPMPLPAPCNKFQVESVVVAPPGDRKIVVREVTFTLNRGQILGIVGPSGSGKSSLARVLVGAWMPVGGSIRLDGAALNQWAPEDLGRHVGYLPQDIELFAGSILQNISRFEPNADPETVIKAASAADVHDLIVGLAGEKGYDTQIGEAGIALSAGERQRVALARALYGDPFLLVLDEPDASLDEVGAQALQGSMLGVRARGGIVIVISHRQSVLGAADLLLALDHGQPMAFGPKELVLQRLPRPPGGSVHILKSISELRKPQA